MKDYIEHNGLKVVLSIALEYKSDGLSSTMSLGQATDINTLINELDKARTTFNDHLQNGYSIVVEVQDYYSPDEYELMEHD